jgi:hypothetical protein
MTEHKPTGVLFVIISWKKASTPVFNGSTTGLAAGAALRKKLI